MQNEDQALLAAILSTAVDAIIVIDSRGTIQSVNQATSQLFGYSDGEMLGNNVRMLMPPPYHEEHDGYLKEYHKTGRAKIIGIGREVTGKRKDNSTFPMHLAVSEVVLGDNKLFAGIVRDTSDLKAVQQQLVDANEQLELRVRQRTEELKAAQADLIRAEKFATLGQVSGGIAHEIRNPLNAIRTSAYYLRNARALSPEKMGEHLERIDRQVSLVDSVITALSDIARLPEPNVVSCDVNAMILGVINTVSIPDNIVIENQVASALTEVTIDPNQIAIVFRNLLRNARDAMPDGGKIQLLSHETAEFVVIEVTDEGIGIACEDLKRITEPLYTTKVRGMGLGLAISSAIINKNRARLEVESEVGVGTTFAVHLPIHPRPRVQ